MNKLKNLELFVDSLFPLWKKERWDKNCITWDSGEGETHIELEKFSGCTILTLESERKSADLLQNTISSALESKGWTSEIAGQETDRTAQYEWHPRKKKVKYAKN